MEFGTLLLAGLFAFGFLLRFACLFASGVVHLRLARLFALGLLLLGFASCLFALALGVLLQLLGLFTSGVVHLCLARLFALGFLLLCFASCLFALALGVLLQLLGLFASSVVDLRFAGLFALGFSLLCFASCLFALALGVFDPWLRIDRVVRARGFAGLAARRLGWDFLVRLRLFLTGFVQGLLPGLLARIFDLPGFWLEIGLIRLAWGFRWRGRLP